MSVEAKEKPEGVRAWYQRTTRKSRKAFLIASIISTVVMALMWAFCSTNALTRLQTFNGALTVPLWGGLWIFLFVFSFLIPSREASFRAQESVERGIELISGAVDIWKRVGLQVEGQIPSLIKQANDTMSELRTAVKTIEDLAKKNEAFIDHSKPVIESLKKIEDKIQHEMDSGIVEDFRIAIEAVKMMAPVPPSSAVKIPDAAPDLLGALKNITKKKSDSSQVSVKI